MKPPRGLLFLLLLPLPRSAQERAFPTNERTILGFPEDLTASVAFADIDGDENLDNL